MSSLCVRKNWKLVPLDCTTLHLLVPTSTNPKSYTVTIWIPDKSVIQMEDLSPVVKWSGIWMVVWKPDWIRPVYDPKCLVFKYPPIHVTLPFEYQTPILSGIQVLGIQMVTVPQVVFKMSAFGCLVTQFIVEFRFFRVDSFDTTFQRFTFLGQLLLLRHQPEILNGAFNKWRNANTTPSLLSIFHSDLCRQPFARYSYFPIWRASSLSHNPLKVDWLITSH